MLPYTNFPLLNTELVKGYIKSINEKEQELAEKVREIQEKCPHKNSYEERGKTTSLLEPGTLIKKQCEDCGLVFKKPEGMPWQICDKCWGPMKYEELGLVAKERTHFYKCTACGHKYSHT